MLTFLFFFLSTQKPEPAKADAKPKPKVGLCLDPLRLDSTRDGVTNTGNIFVLQKVVAKPKKAKEVEKAKPEEKAPEAPAENGEAKAEEKVMLAASYINTQNPN